MGVGAHSVTSIVVEWYLRVENAKIKPKNNIKAKQKSSMPNSLKKAQKVPKCQTKLFKAKCPQKRPNLTYLALRKAKWQPWPTVSFSATELCHLVMMRLHCMVIGLMFVISLL